MKELDDLGKKRLNSELKNLAEVVNFQLTSDRLFVESTMPIELLSEKIENLIESPIVLKGVGDIKESGVVELMSSNNRKPVQGIVRLVQTDLNVSLVDGTIDDLDAESNYKLTFYENGDLSNEFHK